MDKIEKNANDSIDEPFKEIYSRDVTTFLTKNAADHSITLQVTQELERERLAREHVLIDEKIAATLKEIEKTQQQGQSIDRKSYVAIETKNQAMNRFERTDEMINVLKVEIDKIKSHFKNIEKRRLELTEKVNKLTTQKLKNKEFKMKIEKLEGEIRKISDAPMPDSDADLVQENLELKNKLQQKRKDIEIKRKRKSAIETLKNKKFELLQKIYEKQQINMTLKESVNRKKDTIKDKELKLKEKHDEMQEGLATDLEKKEHYLEALEKSVQKSEETQKKIDEIKNIVSVKETQLENLKKKIAINQNYSKEEDDRKKKEYENEMEQLKALEEKLQNCLVENEHYKKAISAKDNEIVDLKEKKGELIILLCEKKNELVKQQHQNLEQKSKNDALSDKLKIEALQQNELKSKHEMLDKKIEDIKKTLVEIPVKLNEKRRDMMQEHKHKTEELMKQQNFQKATIEILHLKLNEKMKKIETLQQEIKEYEEGFNWTEIQYDMRKKTMDKLQEKQAKEQAAYEKLAAQLKRKEEEVKANQKPASFERKAPSTNVYKTPRNKSISQEKEDEVEITVIEEEEDRSSGRKSPSSILKSPYKRPKSPVQANKRVTFVGLSSTESSSSLKSPDELEKNSHAEDMDDFLKDWVNTSYTSGSGGGRRPIDF